MNKLLLTCSALALIGGAPVVQASSQTYNIKEVFFEPDTQPRDSIFIGSFDYDASTKTVSNLHGILSESMSGDAIAYPNDNMAWLTLNNQLVSWYDATLHGTFAATFKNTNTNTFSTMLGGDGWSPQAGVDVGGIYYGYPRPANNPENAYALIFVPDNPLTALNQSQINKLAYADCVKLSGPGGFNGGGMMGAVCMTGTSEAGYGALGTMSGYPVSQVITLATPPVPEPESYAMLLAGLGLVGSIVRRRKSNA